MTPYRFSLLRIIFGINLILYFIFRLQQNSPVISPSIFGGLILISLLFTIGYQRQLVSRSLIFFMYLLFAMEDSLLFANHVIILIALVHFAIVGGTEPWRLIAKNEVIVELDQKKLKRRSMALGFFIGLVIGVILIYKWFPSLIPVMPSGQLWLALVDFHSMHVQFFGLFLTVLFYPSFLSRTRESSVKPILFFDGVCGLCNKFVDFIFIEDDRNSIQVAALQGETARSLLQEDLRKNLSTVVFKDIDGQIYQKSEAVLNLLYRIGGFWRLFFIIRLLPRPLTDLIYMFVAKIRYRIFGQLSTCRLPTTTEREKFLS